MLLMIIIIPLVNTGIIQRDGYEEWAEGGTVVDPPAPTTVLEAHFQGYQVCRWARLGLPDYLSVLPDVLYFDNTYSLLYTKKISYTVEVLLPDKTFEEKIQSLDATGPSSTQ